MQEFSLYEYAVIRALPKVEREEFFNVGLILFCKKEKYIRVDYFLDKKKLNNFLSEEMMEDLELNLKSFLKTAHGEKYNGKIAALEIPERFRWLTAVRSSCLQTSRPRVGMTLNLNATFERLFADLVK